MDKGEMKQCDCCGVDLNKWNLDEKRILMCDICVQRKVNAIKNLQGKRFGRLVAIRPTAKRQNRHTIWLCRCDCGKLVEVERGGLLTGNTTSCGCFQKETMVNNKLAYKHGDAKTRDQARLYRIWVSMKQRCLNPNASSYEWYGKKGIIICNKWKTSYMDFKTWALANGYADNLTIDRMDSNGNYEPLNCQWITSSENSAKAYAKKKELGYTAIERPQLTLKRQTRLGEGLYTGRPWDRKKLPLKWEDEL